jgi:serine/threonine protein kinase
VDRSSSFSGSLLPPFDGSLPARIGGYSVLRRLATGGTSDVLLARAEGPHGFERVVVLKLLLQQYREDKSFERMFALEASAYARLSHPAIVKLFDFFSDAGQLVMVLEHVDGLPLHKLRALLKPLGLPFDDRAALFVSWRIFCALASAHSARDPQDGAFSPVVHRDVNPSNVLIPWDGHVKIADFGIAKVGGVDGDKTQAGFIKGTYGYMAPEQVRGEAVTVAADVYAGCLLLWELLAGRKAIMRGSMSDLDVLRAMAEPAFPSLAVLRPDLPPSLLDAVARGLQPDPRKRTIPADELASALRESFNLDDGRQRLVDALAAVRRPSVTEGSGATTAPPPVVSSPESSADATTPNAVVLLHDATLLVERMGMPTVRPASPPLVATSRPVASLVSTLRLASMRTVPPRVPTLPLSRTLLAPPRTAPPPAPSTPRTPPPPPTPRTPRPAAPEPAVVPALRTPRSRPPPPPAALTLGPPQPTPRTPLPPRPPAARTLAPAGILQSPERPRSPSPLPQRFDPSSFSPATPLPSAAPADAVRAPSYVPSAAPPSPFVRPTPVWTPPPPSDPPVAAGRSRLGLAVVAFLLALAACAGLALAFRSRSSARAYTPSGTDRPGAGLSAAAGPAPESPPVSPPSVASAASAPRSAVPEAPPASAVYETPAQSASTGTVTIAPAHGGHRVWIDKRLVGESPGTFPVTCGAHSVQIGSLGTPMHVQVPCGRDVQMR